MSAASRRPTAQAHSTMPSVEVGMPYSGMCGRSAVGSVIGSMLPRDGLDHPGHQLGGPSRGGRRQARQRIDEVDDVAVVEAIEKVEQAEDGRVRDAAEQLERPLELARF